MLDSEDDDEVEDKPVDMIMKDGIVYSASSGKREQTEVDSSQVSDNSFVTIPISSHASHRIENKTII